MVEFEVLYSKSVKLPTMSPSGSNNFFNFWGRKLKVTFLEIGVVIHHENKIKIKAPDSVCEISNVEIEFLLKILNLNVNLNVNWNTGRTI